MHRARRAARRADASPRSRRRGWSSDHHPLGCGVLGRSGTPVASWFMNESDLLLVFGASFSNHTGIAPYKPIVQVDFDPMALGRFHPVTVPVLGHVGVTGRAAARARSSRIPHRVDQRADVAERWAIWREEKARRLADDRGRGVSSAAVFDCADAPRARRRGDRASTSATTRTRSAATSRAQRQSVLMSGYLGSIGFGFPAAMGAWAAATRPPDRRGDRRRRVRPVPRRADHRGEVRHEHHARAPRTTRQLGKISKEQRGRRSSTCGRPSLHNPDFAEYAQLCGAHGVRVTAPDELDGALKRRRSRTTAPRWSRSSPTRSWCEPDAAPLGAPRDPPGRCCSAACSSCSSCTPTRSPRGCRAHARWS